MRDEKKQQKDVVMCSAKKVRQFCTDVFVHLNITREDAEIVSDTLVSANLRGVDSHGVTRMGIYVDRIRKKLVSTSPNIKIISDKGAALLVDGGNGMGSVVTMKALQHGLERAEAYGSCSIGIRNSNHYGAGGYYVKEAVKHNVAAHMYSNAPPTMAPWGGVEPYIGTNPYSFGVPVKQGSPIIADMASSVVARGKIIMAAKENNVIPEGWAIDTEGYPTCNAQKALDGSVLPFGGPKGYSIALMIDIMSGVLTGANFGPRIPDLYRNLVDTQNVGAFIQLTSIDTFCTLEQFYEKIELMINEIRSIKPVPGNDRIYLPGEIEAETEQKRLKTGIPLSSQELNMLVEIGASCGMQLDASAFATSSAEQAIQDTAGF